MNTISAVVSAFSALIALFAGYQAKQAARMSSFHPAWVSLPKGRRRLRLPLKLGPNDAAGPNDVANKFDGINGATGQALAYRLFAFGYEAHPYGLNVDYAFPEGSNVSSSLGDAATSLVKLLGRKKTLQNKAQHDAWDMLVVAAKAALRTYPDLMSDEVLSPDYKPTPKTTELPE